MSYLLYFVAEVGSTPRRKFLKTIEDAMRGGATVVQLRAKSLGTQKFLALALQVRKLTSKYSVPFIVNDRLDVALASGADGVHLGKTDAGVAGTRELVGEEFIIGKTVRSLLGALKAEREGASYVSLGSIYPTKTKRVPKVVGVREITIISEKIGLPLVAIGGINLSNARAAIESGADGVAVVSAIAGAKDPYAATVELRKLIKCGRRHLTTHIPMRS